MTSVEYDLNVSGGLMPQIQALLAPPVTEENKRLRRERERERPSISHRRPGRAVNHDCCDSCKEGGDLLCCDRCPAAFHLVCHDPPLDEELLPRGEWVCHRCRSSQLESKERDEDEVTSTTSFLGQQGSERPHLDNADLSSTCHRQNVMEEMDFSESVNSVVDENSMSSMPGIDKDSTVQGAEEESSEIIDESPLQTLIRVASFMNPKQFQLPNELQCTTVLPGSCIGRPQGTAKRAQRRDGNRTASKKPAHELDNGIVPLPSKVCFECCKSCRKAPLIQCDFCPLLFHQDCLDPPLTAFPCGRWRCPNHPEHILDEKMLSSTSLTERVKLYDKFSGALSQDAIKVNFLRKIHRHHPPFRYKIKLPPRNRVQVPQAIKDHYKNPPNLLPRVNDPLPFYNESQIQADDTGVGKDPALATQEEQDMWLASVVCLQTEIARFLMQRQMTRTAISDSNNNTNNNDNVIPISAHTNDNPAANATNSSNITSTITNCNSLPQKVSSAVTACSVANNSRLTINGNVHPQDTAKSFGLEAPINGEAIDMLSRTKAEALPGCTSEATAIDKVSISVPGQDSSSGCQGKGIAATPVNKSTVTRLGTKADGRGSFPFQAQNTVISKAPMHNASNSMYIIQTKIPQHTGSHGSMSASCKPGISVMQAAAGSSKTVPLHTLLTKACLNTPPLLSAPTKSNFANVNFASSSVSNLNSLLQPCAGDGSDAELSKLDERLVHVLAWQRLQQLLPENSSGTNETKSKVTSSEASPADSNQVRSRACLVPLSGKGPPGPMCYRVFTIGTGGDMDMRLTSYGHCNYISPRHACIFYDEMTKHFELLNYSEHGTTVDNVLYSCDFSDKNTVVPATNTVVAAVRGIIDRHRGRPEPSPSQRFTMTSQSGQVWKPCNCKSSNSGMIGAGGAGWEGTALLHHGSLVKCGCLQFVFSITECAVKQPPIMGVKPETTAMIMSAAEAPLPVSASIKRYV